MYFLCLLADIKCFIFYLILWQQIFFVGLIRNRIGVAISDANIRYFHFQMDV